MLTTRSLKVLLLLLGATSSRGGETNRRAVGHCTLNVLTFAANTAARPASRNNRHTEQGGTSTNKLARQDVHEWVGEIEAANEREAVEIAAKEFKQPAKKFIAVQRR
jgi:hypothetical protein